MAVCPDEANWKAGKTLRPGFRFCVFVIAEAVQNLVQIRIGRYFRIDLLHFLAGTSVRRRRAMLSAINSPSTTIPR